MAVDEPTGRALLDAAIVAYVGRGRGKVPTTDAAAVAALAPQHPGELLAQVKDAVRVSDTLAFEQVAPFDRALRGRLSARLRSLLPQLGEPAIEALTWRWGYLQFGQ